MNSADKWNLHHTRTQHGFLNRLGNCWGIKACADRCHKTSLASRWVTPWVRRCVILPKKFSSLLTPPESSTSLENCTCSWAGPNAGWHPPCQTTVPVICSRAISPHPANAWIPFFSPHQFMRQKLSFSFSCFQPYHILSSWHSQNFVNHLRCESLEFCCAAGIQTFQERWITDQKPLLMIKLSRKNENFAPSSSLWGVTIVK